MTITEFLEKTILEELSVDEQVAFLSNHEDESVAELGEAVQFLQSKRPVQLSITDAIDVCGTGGSGLSRINTSTISSFLLASLGVPVAKHGNKAASGRFGSFDLLESLGIHFSENPVVLESMYRDTNLVFLFARLFHPIMKHFAPVRQQIGKPTFFNILGPLLSPVDVTQQVIGTAFEDKMVTMAEVCKMIGKERVYIVRGEDGLDEVSLTGRTEIVEMNHGSIDRYFIAPEDFGVQTCTFQDIEGGDAAFNTKIVWDILDGKCSSRHRDLVLVNTALTLKMTDRVQTLKEGMEMAANSIESGKAAELLQRIIWLSSTPEILREIAENKKHEIAVRKHAVSITEIQRDLDPSNRSFIKALEKEGISLIAEIKSASPSSGQIAKKEVDHVTIAQSYESSGASAISVLTDERYFHGNLDWMKDVSIQTETIPILCKDFILDSYQIYEARSHGADAILLIAALLDQETMEDFIDIAISLGMDALCEVHNEEELARVLQTSASIIGINNRDLNTFVTDLGITNRLAEIIPANKIIVSESGISSREDVDQLSPRIDAILVGTSIMKSSNREALIKTLLS